MPAYLLDRSHDHMVRHPCQGVVTLGRDSRSTVKVDDPQASRNHALVQEVGREQFYLTDLGSRNGCYLNDRRVTMPTHLKDGDVIAIGATELVFKNTTPAPDEQSMTSLTQTMTLFRSDVRSIVVFVADIRGYTPFSEKVAVHDLAKLMAKWFNAVQETVAEHGGVIDKFIGDCVLAVWELDEKKAQHCVSQALRAGLRIQELTAEVSPEHDLHVGVGINTGLAAVGAGIEATVMGDTVNLAFRLETASKALKRDIVLSESTYQHLPTGFHQGKVHRVNLKGKSQSLLVAGLTFRETEALLG